MTKYSIIFIIFLLTIAVAILYIDRYNNISKQEFLTKRLNDCENRHVLKMLNKQDELK